MSSARSIVRRNLRAIELRLAVPFSKMWGDGVSILRKKYFEDATDCDRATMSVIKELRGARSNLVKIPGFSPNDICDFINFVCTF